MPSFNFLKAKESQIYLLSFLILYLELIFIRLFPGQVTLLGYYTNFILIASFAGIGLGFLLTKYKFDLGKIFPYLFLMVSVLLSLFVVTITPNSDGEIALEIGYGVVPEYILVPFLFLLLTTVFSTLSQRLGKLFDQTKPLSAYKWDILGSISGVSFITILSFFRTDPVLWLSIFCILYLLLMHFEHKKILRATGIFAISLAILYFGIYKGDGIIRWSPYQKLTLQRHETGSNLLANNISHQFVTNDFSNIAPFYHFPYNVLERNNLDNVLIIGSGMGTDVAVALENGAKQIDAVDIDPEIYRFGKEFNPTRPYQDSRVTFYNNDGRAFLARTGNKYDLVIFALPDSLVVAAGRLNMRLESFLFTKESFHDVKKHLKEGGLVVLYNYYRQPFLVDRLTLMLDEVFGKKSYVVKGGPPYYPAAIMNGEGLLRLKKDLPSTSPPSLSPPPATDDWPFMYMQKPHIPVRYLMVLFSVLVITYLLVVKVVQKPILSFINFNYFFLGVGFFLLETKSIVQFSLLFGTTWITSTLVIVAVLVSVFFATQIAGKLKVNSLKPFYAALFTSLFVQYVFPLDSLLMINNYLRYIFASIIAFSPVFFSNIIFSFTFKESKNNSLNFASNMLGAVFGGALEYAALVTGYRNLVLIIAGCYLLAFIVRKPNNKL